MAHDTQAFFIVSSGRSGTAMLHKVLSSAGNIEMHHEYMVQITQPLAVRRCMDLTSTDEALRILRDTHGAAIRFSTAGHWGDSSNKMSWLIPELAALLPRAKFVHLVRDGRKVAGSYFRKLGAECYDDRSTAILQAFADDPAANPAPPPEKKYWWPIPCDAEFRGFDQFARIAWHWAEVNRVIFESLGALPPERSHFARLEDLYVSPSGVKGLFRFLNLPYRDEHFAMFARPHNVNRPEDELLTPAQAVRFDAIAGAMMARLGYADTREYVVNY
ncbi:MAG TPA: sulfotransferase [Rhizomicrobium sp.]